MREGKRLVENAACRRCHSIDGAGNRLATDLDRVVWQRDQQQLLASITTPVENMPVFGFDRRQAEALIAFLLQHRNPAGAQDAYRVHFRPAGSGNPTNTFEEKCGGCHRLLSPAGSLGRASQGPNLSGLFTRFYPPTAPGDQSWSAKALADWLRNPRAFRSASTMLPVPLTEDELQRVTDQLGAADLRRLR